MSVSALSSRLGVTLTTASLMVGELSQSGLVERREDEADRRRTIVELAPDHRAPLEAWLAARAEPLRNTLARLSEDERAAFLKGMRLRGEELGPGRR